MPILAIDCEGPITQNDNAFELCEAFIPNGGAFFARVSKYDDFLADVERRPGYKAGDTLRLILPFLKSFGVTDSEMESFSKKTLLLLPGARDLLSLLSRLLPAFIISTSYRPYLHALCAVTGFPPDQVFCTDLELDGYILPEEEERALRALALEIASQPLLSWPESAGGREDLSCPEREVLERLDKIFWQIIPEMKIGRIFRDVNPVGGAEKARSVEKALSRSSARISDCLYVGDSITDVQALTLVREGGGAAISFNGNAYALKAAGWACICPHTAIIGAFSRLAVLRGAGAIASLAPPGAALRGRELVQRLLSLGVEDTFLAPLAQAVEAGYPALVNLAGGDSALVIQESEAMRKKVRGLAVGSLG